MTSLILTRDHRFQGTSRFDSIGTVFLLVEYNPGRSSMIRLEVVNNLDELVDLREDWDQLLRQCPYRTPFYSLDWLRIWWQIFGSGFGLRVLVMRDRERIVGIAPLMYSIEYRGPLRIRKLGSIHNYYTPKVDFLLADQADACLRVVLEYFEGQSRYWDMVEITYLPEDSGNAQELGSLLATRRTPCLLRVSHESPYVRFSGDFEKYMGTRSRRFRRSLSNARNRLHKAGDPEFIVCRGETSGRLGEYMEHLFDLSLRSWKGPAGTAIGSHEALRRFYGGVAQCWEAKRGLELRLLKINGTYIASILSLLEDDRVYTLKTSYDIRYRRLSPGNMLFYSLLEDHLNRRAEEIDFLAVRQAYLDRWCTGYRRHFNLCIFKDKNPYSRLIYHLKKDLRPFFEKARVRASSLLRSGRGTGKERKKG